MVLPPNPGLPAVDGGFAAFADRRRGLQLHQVDAGCRGGEAGSVSISSSGVSGTEQAGPTGWDPPAECGRG